MCSGGRGGGCARAGLPRVRRRVCLETSHKPGQCLTIRYYMMLRYDTIRLGAQYHFPIRFCQVLPDLGPPPNRASGASPGGGGGGSKGGGGGGGRGGKLVSGTRKCGGTSSVRAGAMAIHKGCPSTSPPTPPRRAFSCNAFLTPPHTRAGGTPQHTVWHNRTHAAHHTAAWRGTATSTSTRHPLWSRSRPWRPLRSLRPTACSELWLLLRPQCARAPCCRVHASVPRPPTASVPRSPVLTPPRRRAVVQWAPCPCVR